MNFTKFRDRLYSLDALSQTNLAVSSRSLRRKDDFSRKASLTLVHQGFFNPDSETKTLVSILYFRAKVANNMFL